MLKYRKGFLGRPMKFKEVSPLRIFFTICIFLGVWFILWPGSLSSVFADRITDQFKQDIEIIQTRIKDANIRLDGVITEKITLEQAISSLETEIGNLQRVIEVTKAEIIRLAGEIERLEIEIEAQIAILERILVLLYQHSGASSFELIITAETFSDYLDDQEYLDRLIEGVDNSVKQIQVLEAELEAEKLRQIKLLDNQKAQEIVLQATQWEQQQLLIETQNQESIFQQQLTQLQADQAQLEKDLEEYLASLLRTRTSLGTVEAGDIIGKNGNTGWSTGPHLHIAIYALSGTKSDPLSFIYDRNLVWPMGGSGGWVSQGFHFSHQALDIAATEGTPIRAIADGDIIHRGCFLSVGSQYITFGVIIDHGDYLSLYIHLQAPNNPEYEACSINRRSSYGSKSVDYETVE